MGCIGTNNNIIISKIVHQDLCEHNNLPDTPCTRDINLSSEKMNNTLNKCSSRILLYKNSTKGNLILLNVLETDGDSNESIIEKQVLELSRRDLTSNTYEYSYN